ncbi:MAG: SusD/RagB family nutrient-binding outer membrane lipoprotein, partial [Cyclobacteriaceae bacterium]
MAEAINRGWIDGDAATYYTNGINASLNFFGLEEGMVFNVGNVIGTSLGTTTISIADFMENEQVVYKGNNAEGLEQILKQKFVSMWQNSGWEPFFNYRRTGIPAFSVGVGTNAQERIPLRWQ